MFECPHCNEKGIGLWSKVWSGSDTPSKCKNCGKLSYVHSKYRFGMQTAWPTVFKIIGIGASAFLLLYLNNIAFLVLIPIIWLGCSYWELASLPMSPISSEESNTRISYGNTFILILITLAIVIYAVNHL